jgi:hypothetical protein
MDRALPVKRWLFSSQKREEKKLEFEAEKQFFTIFYAIFYRV